MANIASYTTKQDDRLDRIANFVYGTEHNQNVEAIYEANPGLSDQGPILPAGLVLVMPLRSQSVSQRNTIHLWS